MWALPHSSRRRHFRTPQLADGFSRLLAVLTLLSTLKDCSAVELQTAAGTAATIVSDGGVISERPLHRRVVRRERVADSSKGVSLQESSDASDHSNPFFSNPFAGKTLEGEMEEAEAPATDLPLFKWDAGGSWDGDKHALTGEYGFAFVPERDLKITALGRHVDGHWKHKGLRQQAAVTLWRDKPSKSFNRRTGKWDSGPRKMRTVEVGNTDANEIDGKYRFVYIDPILLKAQEEYRITQTCTKDMKDSWFNEVAGENDHDLYTALGYVKVLHGVHSEEVHSYPTIKDDEYQRLGMLNFKFDEVPLKDVEKGV